MSNRRRVMLIILDGWGVAPPSVYNAISKAKTPFFDFLTKNYITTTLQASGIGVGLPWKEEGNSEVGHMNMGAGRIVYQFLPRITYDLRRGLFYKNKAFLEAIEHARKNNSRVHIMGIYSSGNVHGSQEHIQGLIDLMEKESFYDVIIHPFTDGKDGKTKESLETIPNLINRIEKFKHKTPGTIMGRVYALDRNENWDLTKAAYEALTWSDKAPVAKDTLRYLQQCHEEGKTDYDLPPAITRTRENRGLNLGVSDNDSVIFTDFREDSIRQIARAFTVPDKDFTGFARRLPKNLFVVTMTEYEKGLKARVAYPPPVIKNSLAEVLSKAGKTQIHIAETEKYAHVTYFFNGEQEIPFSKEDRILIRSSGGPHYENFPKMQTEKIVAEAISKIDKYDFFLLNLANADMMGHTGYFDAAIKGIQTIDEAISKLVQVCAKNEISVIITADHGNAELMIDPKTGKKLTKHTNNRIPFIAVDEKFKRKKKEKNTNIYELVPEGILADVAPTILHIMNLEQPEEMTGESILYKFL